MEAENRIQQLKLKAKAKAAHTLTQTKNQIKENTRL